MNGTPALILRAGDFFGPGARSSWFSQSLVQPGRPVHRIVNPGKDVGHSWAYLPTSPTFSPYCSPPPNVCKRSNRCSSRAFGIRMASACP